MFVCLGCVCVQDLHPGAGVRASQRGAGQPGTGGAVQLWACSFQASALVVLMPMASKEVPPRALLLQI